MSTTPHPHPVRAGRRRGLRHVLALTASVCMIGTAFSVSTASAAPSEPGSGQTPPAIGADSPGKLPFGSGSMGWRSSLPFRSGPGPQRRAATNSLAAASVSGVLGIDVASYQRDVDWPSYKRTGKQFAYVKATEGTSYVNPYFSSQYAGSRKAGLIRGAYHFGIPNGQSGAVQADYFVANGGGWSADGWTLPGVLDIEYNPYGSTCYGLSPAQMVSWIRSFTLQYKKRTSRDAVIYSTADWWGQCTGNSTAFSSTNPLWVARYASSPGTLPGNWPVYTFWQYSATSIDQDQFSASYSQLQRLARSAGNPSGPQPPSPVHIVTSTRIGGHDRYATAQKVFDRAVAGRRVGTANVVLSGGGAYPDALSANYLAGRLNSGILLTRAGRLSPEARQAITDHRVRRVYITGGTGAVSKSVENTIRGIRVSGSRIQVVRLGGADRYATNKTVNDYVARTYPGKPGTALLASGLGFADALAFGPVAYREHFPIILVRGGRLGTSAAAQLKQQDPNTVVLAGGTASIGTGVADGLARSYRVTRYGGPDRTGTAAAISSWAHETFGSHFNSTDVNLANGQAFPDGLTTGPLAGSGGAAILLAKNPTTLGTATEKYLGGRTSSQIRRIVALGLTGALTSSTVQKATRAVG